MPVAAAATNASFAPTSPSALFRRVNQVFWSGATSLCNAALLRVIYEEGLFHSLNPKLKRPLPLSRLRPKAFCHKLYCGVKCFTAAAHLSDVT